MSFKYHYNLIYNDLDATLNSFKWDSVQTKMAFKTALSCVTAILIANWIKLDNPYWSGITTLVVMRPNVGAIFQKGWMRAAGCIIGCQLLCLYFMGYCIQNPIFFSILIFTGICLAFYLGIQAKYGYFWSYMTANMALIAMIILSNPYNNFPIHIVFYRSAEISLGVLVSWFFNIILWPRYAGEDLLLNISSLIRESADLLKNMITQYESGKINNTEILSIYRVKISALINQCQELISNSESEKKILSVDDKKYREVLRILQSRIDQIMYSYKTFEKIKSSELPSNYSIFFKEIIKELNLIINFKKDNFEKNKNIYIKLQKISNEFNQYLISESEKQKRLSYSVNEVLLFYEIVYLIEAFSSDLLKLCNKNYNLSTNYNIRLHDREEKIFDKDFIVFDFAKKYYPLYLPALKNAVKGGLAIVATFWICLWLNIPGGLGNMSIAILAVFSPQMDNMATKHKGLLRFLGCLTGAALGLIFLSFGIESTLFLIIIVFLVIFGLCIIWAGKPGVAYIGLQAAIPFILCVGSFAPSITIDSAIERLTGIFLAISMMWIFNYVLFPENLCIKLKNKILNLKETVMSYINSEHFLSPQNVDAKDYYPVISNMKNKAASLVKVIELQQDLPIEELNNIKAWTENIEKIIKKFMYLNSINGDVLRALQLDDSKTLQHIRKTINIVINENNDKHRTEEYLDKIETIIESHILNIRKDQILVEQSHSVKKEFALFITVFRHLLNDLKNLSKTNINLRMLSMQ